jgi:hypothetical protein
MIALVIAIVGLFVIFCIATVLIEVERFGWATLTMIAALVLAQFCNIVDIWGAISHNAVSTALYVLGYLVIGVVWSFVKWFSFLMAFRDKFRQEREDFLNSRGLGSIPNASVPDNLLEDFHNFLRRSYTVISFRGNALSQRPRASNNKERIVAWMALWPPSLIGTLLNDPIKRLFTWLFNAFKALYQKMADAIFAKETELK